MKKRGLGKGINALFPETSTAGEVVEDKEEIVTIPLENIFPNPYQPRMEFDEQKLEEMARTISTYGIIQPIVVNKEGGSYYLVAGERRLRAAKIANVDTIPAIVKEFTEEQILEITLIENLQREDLNPIEEASAYKTLMEKFAFTQDELAARLGKSRSSIANALRLLTLDNDIKEYLAKGKLTVGQVRPVLSLEDSRLQKNLVREIFDDNLTARDVEKKVKDLTQRNNGSDTAEKKGKRKQRDEADAADDIFIKDLEEKLQSYLGTKINIKSGRGKEGRIELYYYGEEDLNRLLSFILPHEKI